MEAGAHSRVEQYVHDLSNPSAPGLCTEMLGVAEEACRAGDFDLAVEIYSSQLAELEHKDRGLCLRKADALAHGGRIADAVDSYCIAASILPLRPDELQHLVEVIARTIRTKEQFDGKTRCFESDELVEEQNRDLFSCRLCSCLLTEPVTLVCGHTFCRRCLEDDLKKECRSCATKTNNVKPCRLLNMDGCRVNVIVSGLLEKWFNSESKARRCWMEGEHLWKKQELSDAIVKFNEAVDLEPSTCRLLAQRAELLMEMKNLGQATKDADTMCQLRPLWPRAHYIKAVALMKAGRPEEALQAYLFCVALKPDWSAVKLEAQKDESSSMLQKSEKLNSVGLSSHFAPLSRKRKWPENMKTSEPPNKQLKEDNFSWERRVPLQLLDSVDFECSLCMRLFYEPVTTPCGHTFCLKCLERCLDHNPNCPLCKENLSESLVTRAYSKTLIIEEILQRYLSDELAERRKVHEEEMNELSNLNQEVPIFVCTMAFPTIPCPLHVFEPRYRLMIRRSLETGTKQFGMCIADELKGFADYGCMLSVRDVKFFPDGRSVVDTIGVARFKVLSHGQRDGYHTAKIEYLEDNKIEGEELTELLKLHDSVYDQALAWFTSLKEDMKNQITGHFGQLPIKDPHPQVNTWYWVDRFLAALGSYENLVHFWGTPMVRHGVGGSWPYYRWKTKPS
ncbi:hypothetical protein DNTS_006743 [Danionella cerebrum]|uniref:RING-type domain-containing protein n=1 Tax=Danionella cerebrum TaxID=2873325 RepID=A0A553QZA3_9TELE|nr:hypothetical protein DNTS_006743 [Danionella translucida]